MHRAQSKENVRFPYLGICATEAMHNRNQSLPPSGSDKVFPGRGGNYIDVQKLWWKVRTSASLDDVRLHDLRHSFATTAVESGVSLPRVAKLLGHSKVWTTTRYLHASRKHIADGTQQVSGIIMNRIH